MFLYLYMYLFKSLCNKKKIEKFNASKLANIFPQPKRLVMIFYPIFELGELTTCSRLADV